MTHELTILIVAKAPVAGLAKTRLMRSMSAVEAAGIAAAALLDTLAAVAKTGTRQVVALTGSLTEAVRGTEIEAALAEFEVIEQRGVKFADRLVNAHLDAHDGTPILQIGMDTPQVTPEMLVASGRWLRTYHCVLGPAPDGGWWALGVRDPIWTTSISDVSMSQSDTGALTRQALLAAGADVHLLPPLDDADVPEDLAGIAAQCGPDSHFRRAVAAVQPLRLAADRV